VCSPKTLFLVNAEWKHADSILKKPLPVLFVLSSSFILVAHPRQNSLDLGADALADVNFIMNVLSSSDHLEDYKFKNNVLYYYIVHTINYIDINTSVYMVYLTYFAKHTYARYKLSLFRLWPLWGHATRLNQRSPNWISSLQSCTLEYYNLT
jgi:hypothetical protein